VIKKLGRFDVIILDDLGYVQQTRDEMEVPGPALRARQRYDHQQPALFKMGADIQRPDDHRCRHRPARAPQRNPGAQRIQLSDGSGKEKQKNHHRQLTAQPRRFCSFGELRQSAGAVLQGRRLKPAQPNISPPTAGGRRRSRSGTGWQQGNPPAGHARSAGPQQRTRTAAWHRPSMAAARRPAQNAP